MGREENMLDIRQLAERSGCSESLIRKRVREMEETGRYPEAVKQLGGLKVNAQDFDDFIYRRRRAKK